MRSEIRIGPCVRVAGSGGRTFPEESATTGRSAVRSLGERWPVAFGSRCYSPRVRRPAVRPRNDPPFRLLRMARAPASCGRVEDGLFTVCSDCRAVGCGCAPVRKPRVRGESVGTPSDPS